MNLEWISQKSTSLMAAAIALGFIVIAFLDSRFRYFYLIVAIIALIYGYKQFRKRDTPFEKHEREIRRKRM
jgi:4-hydroxybenzoate polyprenyltransferase